MWIVIAIVAVFALLLLWAIALYNRFVQLRNRVDNAWAQIDVQLKRRRDLIPNLVEAVKGYAAHERETFDAVTKARSAAQMAQGPAATAAAEGILGQALGRLFAVAEAYPDLKANQNFLDLQAQLKDTEDKIAISRQVYNDTVLSVQQRDPGVPGRPHRRSLRLREARVLRADRRRRAGRTDGRLRPGRTRRRWSCASRRGRRAARRLDQHVSAVRPITRPRRLRFAALVLGVAVAALGLAAAAGAKDYRLPNTDVRVEVGGDGTLTVAESITFAYSGPFSGAYRDIPLRRGETIDDISITERGTAYRPGGCTTLGCTDAPGTFGVERTSSRARVVWHYSAQDEARTYTVSLPASRPRRCLRRRRRRQPQGLGRASGRPASTG